MSKSVNKNQELETINIKDIDFDKIKVEDRPEEYTQNQINLLTKDQVIECLKYVDNGNEQEQEDIQTNREQFLNVMYSLDKVTARFIGTESFGDHINHTNTYLIKIKRYGKEISFKFHNSLNDTENKITVNLYDIMTCVANDGTLEVDSFEEFCSELGYSTDSIKDQKLYRETKKQVEKILSIFEESELYAFPQ